MAVKLSLEARERENLLEALLDAYPDYDSLEIMVDLKLNESLAKISKQANQETVVFKLIKWAESNDKLLELIWGAYDKNPENSKIEKITYQLCAITKPQWEQLCGLIININTDFIESACQDSFKSSQIAEVDPRLISLKDFENFEEIEPILKDNFIKKREQSSRNIPSILEFSDCLSRIPKKEINPIRKDLKTWSSEVANQLNVKLDTKPKNENILNSLKRKTIQPYLLISLEDQGSDLLLQGELVIQESDSETIIEQKNLDITGNQQGVKCTKKNEALGTYIQKFIAMSSRYIKKHYDHSNIKFKKEIIIELFLPTKFLLFKMETIPLKIAGKIVRLGCQHQLIFRSLERFELYRDSQQYLERLEKNWIELKELFRSQSPFTQELVKNRFEHYSSCDEQCQELEQRLRDNKKIGINIIFPLEKTQNDLKIMSDILWAINVAGVPLSLWSINKKNTPENLRQNFLRLLTLQNMRNLRNLLSNIEKLRGKAYNPKNPKSFGYGLELLCDNPYRVLSRFIEDDALTFG